MADVVGEPVVGLRERKKRRTRAGLISAAVELCERQGFDGTTVDQIAATADVSPRTFSRYFPTKDAIGLALVDEILNEAALELSRQPLDIGHLEALRRAYTAAALKSKPGAGGTLSEERMLRVLRIVVSSAGLRQTAVEFRGTTVNMVVAERMNTTVDDRRVKLIVAVWGAILMTSLRSIAPDIARCDASIDDAIAAFEATYADFTGEIAGLREPV